MEGGRGRGRKRRGTNKDKTDAAAARIKRFPGNQDISIRLILLVFGSANSRHCNYILLT